MVYRKAHIRRGLYRMEEKERDLQMREEEILEDQDFTESEEKEESAAPRGGEVRISEDVILQLATQALRSVQGVRPAGASPLASLGLGRKTSGGMRVSLDDKTPPQILVDAYVAVKYGLRIPDLAWDVQELVKNHLEKFTGYRVKSVNVFVQSIHLNDVEAEAPTATVGDGAATGTPNSGDDGPTLIISKEGCPSSGARADEGV